MGSCRSPTLPMIIANWNSPAARFILPIVQSLTAALPFP
jgi:hypothetical protein